MLWTAFPPARKCHWSDHRWGGRGYGEPGMQAITTVGLDIAKSVFQVHGVSATGEVIIRRQLKRRHVLPFFQRLPPCVVGMEACATSHHWSREIGALGSADGAPTISRPLHHSQPLERATFRLAATRL